MNFPLDEASLDLLSQGCGIDPGAEHSSLTATLDMLSIQAGSDPDATESVEIIDGCEIRTMRDPFFSVHDAIAALIDEVKRLRAALKGGAQDE